VYQYETIIANQLFTNVMLRYLVVAMVSIAEPPPPQTPVVDYGKCATLSSLSDAVETRPLVLSHQSTIVIDFAISTAC